MVGFGVKNGPTGQVREARPGLFVGIAGGGVEVATRSTRSHASERQKRIASLVRERGSVRASELTDLFGVTDETIRRDLAKFARGVNPRVLVDSASRFGQFTGPVRILWGEDDPFFRTRLGQQLSEAFPHASLTTVPAGRTFLPLDHPDVVASEIAAAAHDTVP